MDSNSLAYHRDVVTLLPKPPTVSASAAKLLDQRERELGMAEPALVTVVGRPAKFISGAEKGDRIEIDLTVNEVAAEKK